MFPDTSAKPKPSVPQASELLGPMENSGAAVLLTVFCDGWGAGLSVITNLGTVDQLRGFMSPHDDEEMLATRGQDAIFLSADASDPGNWLLLVPKSAFRGFHAQVLTQSELEEALSRG